MSKSLLRSVFGATIFVVSVTAGFAQMPVLQSNPVIDTPELLEWPYDREGVTPNLSDPSSNTLHDFHAQISSCELVLSTEGNYYPALKDMWPLFLDKFQDQPLRNWFYTTSPPVALQQLRNRNLQIGNLYAKCRPQVVVATEKVIRKLQEEGFAEGEAYSLYQDQGCVILVKRGNPKGIRSFWDLARADVRYVSPNPQLEPGAFENYAGTLYGIASNDTNPPGDMTPTRLIDRIFNGASGNPLKWLAGPRIHHRDVPWSVACGKGDAGLIFHHLGLYAKETFPERFDIIPLGGTVSDPKPLKGTIVQTRLLTRIKGDWTSRQLEAREKLVETFLSEDFTRILQKRGMKRPPGFVPLGD
ncbi:MAG: substrate-binding domain-containing protein [Desulfomonile tiedjei]|nr:substrate-binding domain-containing protein [Desulfomonile tiedjei]